MKNIILILTVFALCLTIPLRVSCQNSDSVTVAADDLRFAFELIEAGKRDAEELSIQRQMNGLLSVKIEERDKSIVALQKSLKTAKKRQKRQNIIVSAVGAGLITLILLK